MTEGYASRLGISTPDPPQTRAVSHRGLAASALPDAGPLPSYPQGHDSGSHAVA